MSGRRLDGAGRALLAASVSNPEIVARWRAKTVRVLESDCL